MPSHVSLCLDDVITGYIGAVVQKVCHARPNAQSRSSLAVRGEALRLIRDPVQDRHDQLRGCGSFLSATFRAEQIYSLSVWFFTRRRGG